MFSRAALRPPQAGPLKQRPSGVDILLAPGSGTLLLRHLPEQSPLVLKQVH
jgi:hypothetical protein